MNASAKTKVLLVDDEPRLMEGLALHLHRKFDVITASSGAEGLERLDMQSDIAVIISDMRMPVMDGAAFLAESRRRSPDTVRMLLTGQTDLRSAISAVNEGQIFRFLTKPCAPPTLQTAVEAAVVQHRLITAEKVLLEQTLQGSIRTLTEVLALVDPQLFGRATHIKNLAASLAESVALPERWQLDVAAMLSQLAHVTLPPETADKLRRGRTLNDEERRIVARLPEVADKLLAHIPRLEVVRAILLGAARPFQASDYEQPQADRALAARGAQLLAVAEGYDRLLAAGIGSGDALGTLRGRQQYDPDVVQALGNLLHENVQQRQELDVSLKALAPGMLLVGDLLTTNDVLLLGGGFELTRALIERLRSYPPQTVREPIRVNVATG